MHRQANLTVALPHGAKNLQLKLKRHDFVFGTAYQPETAPDLSWYSNMTASMFWALTPENRFKWFNYEIQPGVFQESKDLLDELYIKFAQDHQYSLVRGHTLEWKTDFPFWAHELSCSEYVTALRRRVQRDVAAFRGRFNQYDVFNEVIKYPAMLEICDLWDTAFPGECSGLEQSSYVANADSCAYCWDRSPG